MKELSIEEKAKRYNETIEMANSLLIGDQSGDAWIYRLFPELQESEDERIRKHIIEILSSLSPCHFDGNEKSECIAWLEKQKTTEEALQYLKENHSPSEVSDFQAAMNIAAAKAYNKGYTDGLEKQGEQKPTEYTLKDAAAIFLDALSKTPYNKPIVDAQVITKELLEFLSDIGSYNPNAINEQKPAWSEEDAYILKNICELVKENIINPNRRPCVEECLTWLNSLKVRVQPQPEWSEEDERLQQCLIEDQEKCLEEVENNKVGHAEIISDLKEMYRERIDWLKSLKDRITLTNKNDFDRGYEVGISAAKFNQWKPTEEQMKALNDLLDDYFGSAEIYKTVESLYNDLKKL